VTTGAAQLSFGIDKPSQYTSQLIVQRNGRQPFATVESGTVDQFRASDIGKALKSRRLFFVTAQLAGGGKFVSSRYEGVDLDAILAKVEAVCPFDAESLMSDLSAREQGERTLRTSVSDLTLIRWALGQKYGALSGKPDQAPSLSAQERGYLKRYAGDNGLPLSQYLTAESARRLTAEGQALANLASPLATPTPSAAPWPTPSSTPSPTPSPAAREFYSYDNTDFDGDDIKPWLFNASFSDCRTACRDNSSCRAFTFNKRRNVCILKSGTGQPKPSIEAVSASVIAISVPRFGITIQNGIDLPGGDLAGGLRNISLDQCSSACQSNASCAGFSYIKSKRWCWMKRQIVDRRLNDDIVSGVK
jgi:hypothetical protein